MMSKNFTHLIGRSYPRRLLILGHDSVIVASAFPIAICLRENFDPDPLHLSPAAYGTALLLIIVPIIFGAAGVQQTMWRYASPRDLLSLARALFGVVAVFFPLMFLIDRLDGIPRSALFIFWFVAFAGLCASRMIYIWGTQAPVGGHGSQAKRPPCRILVMANLQSSSTIAHTIRMMYRHETTIVGIVGHGGERGRLLDGIEILGEVSQLKQILAFLDVSGSYPHAIVVGDNDLQNKSWLNARIVSEAQGIEILPSSQIHNLGTFIADRPNPVDIFSPKATRKRGLGAKRCFDIAVSVVALFLLLPLMALIAGLLCIFHGRPITFTQLRAGKHLREFRLLKFRTMKSPMDNSGRILHDRERITRIGSFLRASRLDELPQFLNVLFGDMSLIGPRPLLHRDMPTDVDVLTERYGVRPGITGWAQVNGGHKIENQQKILLDLFYIRNCSIIFDIKIIILTMKMMVFGEKIDQNAIKIAQLMASSQ